MDLVQVAADSVTVLPVSRAWYDSTVLIAAISMFGSVLTAGMTLLIHQRQSVSGQKLDQISVKVDGRLSETLDEMKSLRAQLSVSKETENQAVGEVAGLRSPIVLPAADPPS